LEFFGKQPKKEGGRLEELWFGRKKLGLLFGVVLKKEGILGIFDYSRRRLVNGRRRDCWKAIEAICITQ